MESLMGLLLWLMVMEERIKHFGIFFCFNLATIKCTVNEILLIIGITQNKILVVPLAKRGGLESGAKTPWGFKVPAACGCSNLHISTFFRLVKHEFLFA